ncbi:hypothetical protein, partial [Myroides odoratimimus]|uniref:hypothetical protein n=1 Tax=Myroides odoratimimus TaxID=76832 RepID=UPI002DB7923E
TEFFIRGSLTGVLCRNGGALSSEYTVNEVLDEMLRDSKLMHDKLDQSIKGLITDALDESIASVPSIDSYNKLVEDISSLKKEQDTYLELLEEAINDRKISHEKVTI